MFRLGKLYALFVVCSFNLFNILSKMASSWNIQEVRDSAPPTIKLLAAAFISGNSESQLFGAEPTFFSYKHESKAK